MRKIEHLEILGPILFFNQRSDECVASGTFEPRHLHSLIVIRIFCGYAFFFPFVMRKILMVMPMVIVNSLC